ncbi:ribonuclease H-like domain-containing protein, partial [Tanacetum coccineum]
ETLPDLRSAYATISSEESHRVDFVSNVSNREKFRRNQTSNNAPRPNNVNNNGQGGGSGLVCENYGANQHMTHTDKKLDNVYDISHLRIKVGYPNGTKSFIFKIGNLKLFNGLDLYDVLVIPEYCVTLNSIHKLAKDNKIFVAFDEGKCVNTDDFSSGNFGNDAQSSDDIFAAQDEHDVNNAFLYGDLVETVYMKPLEGYFPSGDNKSKKGVFVALLVYVDDIVITSNSVHEIEKFKTFLKSKFMIGDLRKLKYFLRIEVIETDQCICLNQTKYVLDLLSKYDMLACKPAKTPLQSKLVNTNEANIDDLLLDNITDYQKLMGKLIYLTNTRLDIFYVVHCLSQFMHSLLKSHLKTAFKILRYLKRSSGLRIHITKSLCMSLKAYSDVEWAKCVITRTSVM